MLQFSNGNACANVFSALTNRNLLFFFSCRCVLIRVTSVWCLILHDVTSKYPNESKNELCISNFKTKSAQQVKSPRVERFSTNGKEVEIFIRAFQQYLCLMYVLSYMWRHECCVFVFVSKTQVNTRHSPRAAEKTSRRKRPKARRKRRSDDKKMRKVCLPNTSDGGGNKSNR